MLILHFLSKFHSLAFFLKYFLHLGVNFPDFLGTPTEGVYVFTLINPIKIALSDSDYQGNQGYSLPKCKKIFHHL